MATTPIRFVKLNMARLSYKNRESETGIAALLWRRWHVPTVPNSSSLRSLKRFAERPFALQNSCLRLFAAAALCVLFYATHVRKQSSAQTALAGPGYWHAGYQDLCAILQQSYCQTNTLFWRLQANRPRAVKKDGK
jgi:hypothetical protein